MEPSPSGRSVDNHPDLVVHPRMNYRSEQYPMHCVRTPLTLRLPCIVFLLLLLSCIYCFSPSYCPIDPTTVVDARVIDYVVDDPAPTRELPGKQSHSLPQTLLTFSVLICTL